jgi:hypothetical protein
MSKQALSVTLEPENILWLRGRARAEGRRSLSETLDRLVAGVRSGGGTPSRVRSVVGNIRIDESKGNLAAASETLRELFAESLDKSADLLGAARTRRRRSRSARARSRA